MKCIKCSAHLGAGETSCIPDNEGITYKLICRVCETVQPQEVIKVGGRFLVVDIKEV